MKKDRTVHIEIAENTVSIDEALSNLAKVIAAQMLKAEKEDKHSA